MIWLKIWQRRRMSCLCLEFVSFCEKRVSFFGECVGWKVRYWFNLDQSRPAKVLRLSKSNESYVVADVVSAGGLKELVLQAHGCSLTEETITHLEVFIQRIRAKGGPIETWIDIEGTNLKNSSSQCSQCLQCFRCFASSSRFKASQRSVAESKTSCVVTNDSSDMPFPCSHNGCFRFHSNAHGFCQEHRWSRFTKQIVPALKTGWNWLQLLMLLLAQASVEIQDRWLLMLILMSLLPTATLFLQKDIGWFSTCFSIPLFVGMLGSWIQIGKRFDKMQRAMLELLLTTEAMYLGNLQATGEGAHQGLLFDEDVAGTDLQQSVTDLRGNFGEAKRLRLLFQTAVCVPLSQMANRQVEAKVRYLTDCDISVLSVDVLYCKVLCAGLRQIQEAWHMLKGLADTQDIHIKSWHDDFARVSASKKCCRVVLSIEGYFATVLLVDETIDQLEQELDSMHHFANALGLLDEAKPQHWASTFEAIATPHWCRMVTWLLRCAAQFFSATIGLAFILLDTYSGDQRSVWAVPFFVLIIVFAYDSRSCLFIPCPCCPRMQRRRLKPTQILYRKHFGAGEFIPSQGCHLAASHSYLASQGKVFHAECSSRWSWDWPLVSSQLQVLYWLVKFQHHLPCPYLGLSAFCSFTCWGCMHGCCAWFELCGALVGFAGTHPKSNGFPFFKRQSTPVAGRVGIPWFLELHVRLLQCCARLLCLPIFGTNQLASAFAISAAQEICRATFHADDVRCGICT